MQTQIDPRYAHTRPGQQADEVLRSCVHCGFCNATCPTYQLLGDELDGPRGRIYQIKQLLEGEAATHSIQQHLDRCLTCRACETTCPSGVEYHKLLDIGRTLVEQQVARPWHQRLLRRLLVTVLPYRQRFEPLFKLGQLVRPLLPAALRQRVPARDTADPLPASTQTRFVILLQGCVQPSLAPAINRATQRVLDRLGIATRLIDNAGCCGALPHHLDDSERALAMARSNIDAWWPSIEKGAEAVVSNASGCTPMLKDYGRLLGDDPAYADKAQRVSELCRDLSEFIAAQDVSALSVTPQRIAFHAPCTLQHAQKLDGVVERLLGKLGFELTAVKDSHLCCGSAGTYSILQPALSGQLRDNKLAALQAERPTRIATANIGCLLHLQAGADVPVQHWIELLER